LRARYEDRVVAVESCLIVPLRRPELEHYHSHYHWMHQLDEVHRYLQLQRVRLADGPLTRFGGMVKYKKLLRPPVGEEDANGT
jgi:hypothetical protein